ncbi:MAG: OmpA family protein [Bacteroidales bacterium]|jgi:outer membrane protein OmpA-like peptidoglycan-associated protein|nr:OmpA family protein [Bacteroidales bacterium]
MKNKKNISFTLTIYFVLSGMLSYSQIDIRGKIKQKVEERVEQKVDEKIDEGLDEIFNENEEMEAEESEEAKENEEMEETNTSTKQKETSTKPQNKPKLESYTTYDFVPGDKILFYDDFSQDAIGDFPALWSSNSSGEVKTINIAEGKWFHMNGNEATYAYSQTISFPDNFIIEFDIIPNDEFGNEFTLTLYEENPENAMEVNTDLYPGLTGLHINIKKDGWDTKGYNNVTENTDWITGSNTANPVLLEEVNHVIIWIQKRRVRIYHRGAKVFDSPTNLHKGTKFNRFLFTNWCDQCFPMINNFKITTASPDMRSKLLTEGKIISYGIYFDSGKDIVKPESYGSLKEIAKVLTENPDVKIKIIGHTDSDGNDALNLDLSKRRALNVKNALMKDFGINGDRIQTDGKGEIEPLVPNTSTENKAKNRRVEFIKI